MEGIRLSEQPPGVIPLGGESKNRAQRSPRPAITPDRRRPAEPGEQKDPDED